MFNAIRGVPWYQMNYGSNRIEWIVGEMRSQYGLEGYFIAFLSKKSLYFFIFYFLFLFFIFIFIFYFLYFFFFIFYYLFFIFIFYFFKAVLTSLNMIMLIKIPIKIRNGWKQRIVFLVLFAGLFFNINLIMSYFLVKVPYYPFRNYFYKFDLQSWFSL